jgi:C-terminal processing protease CtpA/Prc
MNEGVQILLERMKTHPEEFVAEAQYGVSKWSQAIQHFQEYLSKEDKEALDVAWKQTISDEMQRRFTQAVMEELVDPKVEKEQWGDSVLDAAGLTKQHIAQHKIFLAQQQAQAAQQAPGSITNLVGGAGQGLLGTWFGGNK